MLGTIRKFSSSIYAKILLIVVAIPFVFWGMGPVFQGGKVNVIAEIGKDKISTQEFVDFLQYNNPSDEILDKNSIEKLLSTFIGTKLIAQEIKNLDIRVSDISLSKIIRNEKAFMKDDKFSRIEYEKFLVNNNLSAASFEANILEQIKKEQLFDFIGGGIVPANFLIEISYNHINQKRNIEVINLNDVFKNKLNFTNDQIELFYNLNLDNFKNMHKTIKFLKLDPKNLTASNEFNDLFFKRLDEIDDLIVEGKNIDFILNQFDLESVNTVTFNELNKDKESEINSNFPNELIKKVFDISKSEPTVLIEHDNTYFIIEVIKSENVQRKINSKSVRSQILKELEKKEKVKLTSEIINKINENNFMKVDFYKLSKDKNVVIKKVRIDNQNDNKFFKQKLINQIYSFGKNKVIIVADTSFSEIFLIYIDKIENALINKNSQDYNKYLNLSKTKIISNLSNTYDLYLNNKYKININYKALNKVNSYFR